MCVRQLAHQLAVSSLLAVFPLGTHVARAQQSASVSLPDSSIRAIAADFDAGRNSIYCFHGVADPAGVVRVDGVSTVPSPAECFGIGIGFISRIDDREFLGSTLRGLIATNDRFRIVSAFYSTVIVNDAGRQTRAPRAMSIIRGHAGAKTSEEDPHQRRVGMRGS